MKIKTCLGIVLAMLLLSSASVAAEEQGFFSKIGTGISKFVWDAKETVKKVAIDARDFVVRIGNNLTGKPAEQNQINYQKKPFPGTVPGGSAPKPTNNYIPPTDSQGTQYRFYSDSNTEVVTTYTKKIQVTVADDEPLYYDLDLIEVGLDCPDCQLIDGEKFFSAGYQYELYIVAVNHGNTGTEGVEVYIEVKDEYGFKYVTSFTGSNALKLPVGEVLIGPILLPTLGTTNKVIDKNYIFSPPGDKPTVNLTATVELKKSSKVVEKGRKLVANIVRTCTTSGTLRTCKDETKYVEEFYTPTIPEIAGEDNLRESLLIEKLVPQITGSRTQFCVYDEDSREVGIC